MMKLLAFQANLKVCVSVCNLAIVSSYRVLVDSTSSEQEQFVTMLSNLIFLALTTYAPDLSEGKDVVIFSLSFIKVDICSIIILLKSKAVSTNQHPFSDTGTNGSSFSYVGEIVFRLESRSESLEILQNRNIHRSDRDTDQRFRMVRGAVVS